MVDASEKPIPAGDEAVFDQMEIRCPKLGGEVTFGYCRREGGRLPCQRALVCWQLYFPVEAYLKVRMNVEDWQRCFLTSAKPRIESLLECIEAAKKRVEG
ncbi:MAG: hypothetical protein AB9873_06055 [Syntrophobacteraceae bacterium]